MTAPVHIYFVLDRSGSMKSIRDDVIGGFNSFVEEQRRNAGECRVTLVQFDSQDPYEVLFDAVPLAELPSLSRHDLQPRGATPLYDAMGHAMANAAIRMEQRAADQLPAEQILVVTMTDGRENASREYTRSMVFDAITVRTKAGWTFAYLGANQDALAEGEAIGYAAGSTRGYTASAEGTADAFGLLSKATSRYRAQAAGGAVPESADFFTPADEDAAGKPSRP